MVLCHEFSSLLAQLVIAAAHLHEGAEVWWGIYLCVKKPMLQGDKHWLLIFKTWF
jgi:hypothetical protein